MTRTKQIPRSELDESLVPIYDRLFDERDPVSEPGTATGTPGNWWTVFAQTPDLMNHMIAGFALFKSSKRALAPKLCEIALTRTGFVAESQFVFSQHCKAARHAGVSDAQLLAIPAWTTSSEFDAAERAVLAYTDELVLADGRVQDATFAVLSEHLGETEVIELTYAVASYKLHALMCRALRLEYDDVDERIVEIAAPGNGSSDNGPSDNGASDVMGTISMQD